MILNLCPYWVYPVTGGGPSRVFNLNNNISSKYKIYQISYRPTYVLKNYSINNKYEIINDKYLEYKIFDPLMIATSYILYTLTMPFDLFLSSFANRHTSVINKIREKYKIIQVEHPWLFSYAEKIDKKNDCVKILSTHNCESKFYLNNKWGDKVYSIEKKSIENADIVLAVSMEDVNDFYNILKVKKLDNVHIIPNGVNIEFYNDLDSNVKTDIRKKYNVENKIIVLFMGSIHKPNLDALTFIEDELSKITPDNVHFLIIGSVGNNKKDRKNITYMGYMKDYKEIISISDIALNPLLSGSGTSLKILEYMAAGIPCITTNAGNRGYDFKHKEEIIISERESFNYWINELKNNDDLYNKISKKSRKFVKENYDWKIISNKLIKIYDEFLV